MKYLSMLESYVKNESVMIDDNLFYINNITENEFNEFNSEKQYIILKPIEIKSNIKIYRNVLSKEKFDVVITSIGNIIYNNLFVNYDEDLIDEYFDPNEKAIVFFKKRNSELNKKYETIRDLNNNNIGLYVHKIDKKAKIIVYEIDKFNSPISNIQEKSILCYSEISNVNYLPFGGSKIFKTVSRPDVNGKEILYLLSAYFADNKILISDRNTVSHYAKRVWKDFFSFQNILYPYAPIDNQLYPLTTQTIDDGDVFSKIEKDLKDIINLYLDKNQQQDMLKILNCKNKEDILKIIDDIIYNDLKQSLNNLIKYKQINQNMIYKFITDLMTNNFKIDLEKIRSKKYLDWAYKINSSIESSIKDIIVRIIGNHNSVNIKNRDGKLEEYATDLWSKRRL